MNTKFDFGDTSGDTGSQPIVYVREVLVTDLPEDIRLQATDVDILYAVHDASGERLALVKDRQLAFTLARQHDLTPVSVH